MKAATQSSIAVAEDRKYELDDEKKECFPNLERKCAAAIKGLQQAKVDEFAKDDWSVEDVLKVMENDENLKPDSTPKEILEWYEGRGFLAGIILMKNDDRNDGNLHWNYFCSQR